MVVDRWEANRAGLKIIHARNESILSRRSMAVDL
jgi:hypothetical protein